MTPGVFEVYFAVSYGLYLGAEKFKTGFEGFRDKIVVLGFFVLGDLAKIGFVLSHLHFTSFVKMRLHTLGRVHFQ